MSRRGMCCAVALLTVAAWAGRGLGAQMAPGARSVGMGGAGMVFATGVDAVEWNPANLAWGGGWNLAVAEIGIASMSSGAAFDEILAIAGADLFGSGDLDVEQIVAGLPASGIRLSAVSEGVATAFALEKGELPQPGSPLPSIGLSLGSLGVRVRSRVLSEVTISSEIADLIGNGFSTANLQNYAVGNTGWGTTSLTEVTVGYGTTVGGLLSLGVGGRYVMGHSMMRGRFFEPQVDLATSSLTIDAVGVEATNGTGFGLDVGASLDLPGGLRAAVSGTNVVQRMTWDDALVAHSATYTDADFDAGVAFIDLIDRFDSQPVDPGSVSLTVYEAARGLFEESYFPQVFRGGVGWQSGGTSLEAVGIKVSPRGRFTTAWDERLSLGVEQRLPVLTLRAGYAMGDEGLTAMTGGIGLGLGPLKLETSVGKFSSDDGGTSRDGYYGTVAIQIKGGGL